MKDILEFALSYYGINEIPGEKDNPIILDMFKDIGHSWVKHDETAWCSAFVNYCAKNTGYEWTGKLNARSWLNVGQSILEPELGDIVIFWRLSKDSVYGHVGFHINKINNLIYTFGGNQNNMVNISPYLESRVLGYRKLRKI